MNKKQENNELKITNILEKIFEKREEELYDIKDNERNLLLEKSKAYSNIYIAIDNVPPAFRETRQGIENSIENYLEVLNNIQGIENKKFYEEGFSDAINLVINCISRKEF